jgi:serine/threonine-protein kinase
MELLLRWEESRRSGREIAIEELCVDSPELADELIRRIGQLRALEAPYDAGSDAAPVDDTALSPSRHPDLSSDGASNGSAGGPRYRRLRLHARGGIGEVFVAHDEELGRDVALKEIQARHAQDPQSRARFLIEAEVTARLEHPNIVPVHGRGLYSDGRPYYAMRFIQGESLKDAIERYHRDGAARLDDGERMRALHALLRRFLAVCDAIGYAHSRGVLHRDIKPGNIMLGPFGETLVVDWGLAKCLGRPNLGDTSSARSVLTSSRSGLAATAAGSAVGTPAYMSPEQARGELELLGPLSDVYSLGATLYCLLTGHAPFAEDSPLAVARRVEIGAFAPPRSVRSDVSGALEAVCLKAMALLPEKRYSSVGAMSEDIERWLADEPVAAWREPLRGRARRWANRHHTPIAVTAGIVLVALAGMAAAFARESTLRRSERTLRLELAASNRNLDRRNAELQFANAATVAAEAAANRRLEETMKAIEEYYTGVSEEALRGGAISKELRERFLDRPRQFYTRLTRELAAQPRPSEREQFLLARGHLNLGRILGILIRNAEAEREDRAAIAVMTELVAAHPSKAEYQLALAEGYNRLGNVSKVLGRLDEGANAYQEVIDVFARLIAIDPGVAAYRSGQAGGYNNLGTMLRAKRRSVDAVAAYRKSIDAHSLLLAANPDVVSYKHALAWNYSNLGLALADADRLAEAVDAHRKAAELRVGLVATAPDVVEYQEGLGAGLINLGSALTDVNRLAEAAGAYRDAIAAFKKLDAAQPNVPSEKFGLVMGYNNLAEVLMAMGQLTQAAEMYRAAIDTSTQLVAAYPDVPDYQHGLGGGNNNLASVLCQTGELAAAADAARHAIDIYTRLVAARANHPEYLNMLSAAWNTLGATLAKQGRHAGAAEAYSTAIKHQRPLVERLPRVSQFRLYLSQHYEGLAETLCVLGRLDESAQATRERAKLWPNDPEQLFACVRALARCVPLARDEGQKNALAREAVETLREATSLDWNDTSRVSHDPDLAPLKDRDDFRRLVDEVGDRSFPKDPFAP